MARMIVCKECGKTAYNYGRGLCSKCYSKLKKENRLPPPLRETNKETKQKETKSADHRVLVDFSRAPALLEMIKQKAEEEFRSVEMQILWELRNLIPADLKVGGTI